MKHLFSKFSAYIYILPMLLLPSSVFAVSGLSQAETYLGEVETGIGVDAATPLPELIGQIIQVLLSVLGIIFVVLTVYAGYLYLTAAGDDAKVKKAKTLLGQAIIGLIIIVAAYSIAAFILDALQQAAA